MTEEEFMHLPEVDYERLVFMTKHIALEEIAENNGGWEASVYDSGEGWGHLQLWPIGLGYDNNDPSSAHFNPGRWYGESIIIEFEAFRAGWYDAWSRARALAGDSGGITLLDISDPVELGFLKRGRAA